MPMPPQNRMTHRPPPQDSWLERCDMRTALFVTALVWAASWTTAPPALAEVYRWVDENGKVHYGDKRHAKSNDVVVNDDFSDIDPSGKSVTVYAVADTELDQRSTHAHGAQTTFAVSQRNKRGVTYTTTGLIKFDMGPLLRFMHNHSSQKMAFATLRLTIKEDKESAPTIRNNAFFILPSHNNWQETTATWNDYYEKHITPFSIKKLPSMTAPSSTSLEGLVYEIDALPLMQAVTQNNIRELTLELKLQRLSAITDVVFFAKENGKDTAPNIIIEFVDNEQD